MTIALNMICIIDNDDNPHNSQVSILFIIIRNYYNYKVKYNHNDNDHTSNNSYSIHKTHYNIKFNTIELKTKLNNNIN